MGIYIIEDDETMIEILSDLIGTHELGIVIGSTEGKTPELTQILDLEPDMILVDFLMPEMDGVALVRELKRRGCRSKFIMISQVSSKDMIGMAYDAGVQFFINKPVNIHEVSAVIRNTSLQIKNERTIENLRTMFLKSMKPSRTEGTEQDGGEKSGEEEKAESAAYRHQLMSILGRIGMAGEKGSADIVQICSLLREQKRSISCESVKDICTELSDTPKSMEQRMRRAISAGLSNVAHLGTEDFLNETFAEYSSTLFPFEEVRKEMDLIRGKSAYGGEAPSSALSKAWQFLQNGKCGQILMFFEAF